MRNFRENLDRVPPCPSTWHKYQKIWEKFLLKSPFSGHLKSKRFLANKAGFNTSSIFLLLDCNESLQKTWRIFKHLKMHIIFFIKVFSLNMIGWKRHLYNFSYDIFKFDVNFGNIKAPEFHTIIHFKPILIGIMENISKEIWKNQEFFGTLSGF